MPNRLVASLLLAMLFMSTIAMAALPTNAEVEAILNKHFITNNKAKGVAVGLVDSSSSLLVDTASREGVFVIANSPVKLNDIALHLMDNRHSLAEREFPKTVVVGASVLAAYVGVYKLNDDMHIQVRVTGVKVTAQATGQGAFEIFPESETKFFAKVAPIVMTFGDITDGKAGSFVLEQGGSKLTARRMP